MNEAQPKFFLYARKSTDDLSRQVRSIDDQIAELRELAKREGLSITDTLIEKQTAKVPGRPVFNAMLDRIEKGEATGILAWHPDRLARNSLDGGRLIHLVDARKITDLKFCTFVFEPSASGKFMLAIMFGQSKYYVDNLSENIKRGHRQKVKNGVWPMVAPVGYLNDKATRGIVPDPHRAPLIRTAFELYATGDYTLDRLTGVMNDLELVNRYGDPIRRNQFHRILQNPIYCGIIRHCGEDHEGKHEPLVSKKLFDDVQAIIGNRSRATGPKRKPYKYRGMFRCGECGCFITTETQKGHNYLHCTKRVKRDCSQPFVREEKIAAEIADYIATVAVQADNADGMIAALEAEQAADTDSRQDTIRALRASLKATDEKLDRLMHAYLDKAISLEEYREAKKQLVEEKQEQKDRLSKLESRNGSWFEPAIRFVNAAKQAAFLTERGTEEENRDFLKKVGSNLTISNRHLSVTPRGAWKLVVDQGHFAQHNAAPELSAAASVGETDPVLHQAERGRFELPLPLRADRFSKPDDSDDIAVFFTFYPFPYPFPCYTPCDL